MKKLLFLFVIFCISLKAQTYEDFAGAAENQRPYHYINDKNFKPLAADEDTVRFTGVFHGPVSGGTAFAWLENELVVISKESGKIKRIYGCGNVGEFWQKKPEPGEKIAGKKERDTVYVAQPTSEQSEPPVVVIHDGSPQIFYQMVYGMYYNPYTDYGYRSGYNVSNNYYSNNNYYYSSSDTRIINNQNYYRDRVRHRPIHKPEGGDDWTGETGGYTGGSTGGNNRVTTPSNRIGTGRSYQANRRSITRASDRDGAQRQITVPSSRRTTTSRAYSSRTRGAISHGGYNSASRAYNTVRNSGTSRRTVTKSRR